GAALPAAARDPDRAGARTLGPRARRPRAHAAPCRALEDDDARAAPARAPGHEALGGHEPGTPPARARAVPAHARPARGRARGTAGAMEDDDAGGARTLAGGAPPARMTGASGGLSRSRPPAARARLERRAIPSWPGARPPSRT